MPMVSVVMGSKSDYGSMSKALEVLKEFEVDTECRIVSAHRTPALMYDYAKDASGRGIEVIIAGAGGAAHLPGMIASLTRLPVIGVPIPTSHLSGMDSLLSIVQMPTGIPVATVAIGSAGNAALLSVRILGLAHPEFAARMDQFMARQTDRVLRETVD